MRKELEKLREQISKLIGQAEEKQDSENEKTIERYETIVEALGVADDAVSEAIAAFY